jgi:hypothetical protein
MTKLKKSNFGLRLLTLCSFLLCSFILKAQVKITNLLQMHLYKLRMQNLELKLQVLVSMSLK